MDKRFYNETWYYYLTGEWHTSVPDEVKRWQAMMNTQRKLFSWLPSDPHCHECGIPMAGFGGNALRFMGSAPSSFSPGYAVPVKNQRASMKWGRKWN